MGKFILLLSLSLASLLSYAQEKPGKITGSVVDPKSKGIEAATVQLLRVKDQGLVKFAVTNGEGKFELEKIAEGKYLINITAVGFEKKGSEAFEITAAKSTVQLPALQLENSGKSLGEVTVTGKKPMVENKIDKTVVNVEAFISNAGGTAMDVLEKSPGISVDRDGIISLKGKQGVIILMDGKQTFLSGQDLANLLKNMPANQLETIEIMTQPSSKYDASGNSGIINIKTKKNSLSGFNGSINLSYVQGVYPKSPNSINVNYKKNKVNLFANYSYSFWQGFGDLNILRKFRNNSNELTSVFDQLSIQRFKGENHNLRTGMDYAIDKKTSIGFVVNAMYNPRQFSAASVSDIYNGAGQLDSTNVADSRSKDPWKNIGTNINFRKTLDTAGRELTADVDYVRYTSTSRQSSFNYTFFNPGHKLIDSFFLKGNLPSDIKIYTAKMDYVHPLKKGAKIEAGLKSSYVETDNNAQYTKLDNTKNEWINDGTRSNHFLYDENINAAYFNYSRHIKKIGIQGGLRYEYTKAKGKQMINQKNFDRSYGQLFPTAYISYAMNKKNNFSLSYGRRIQRPNYQDMNPFQYFLDQYTYREGNPFLTPQFSHNLELSHNFKGELNTNISFTETTDIINDVLKQNNVTKVTLLTRENIARRRNIGMSVSYNKALTKWWTTSIFANLFNNKYDGIVNNRQLNVNISSLMFNVNNQLKFKKGWGGEVSGFYRTKMQDGGLIVSEPMGVVSFGVSKQIIKSKGTLKLNIIDPFYIQNFRGFTQFGEIDMTIRNKWDNRRVGLGFSYRFGKTQNNGPAKRKTGSSQDEQSRVGGGQQQ
ncbi:MAG: TonB-dependent receptor [Chitinophagaceae bacterium]